MEFARSKKPEAMPAPREARAPESPPDAETVAAGLPRYLRGWVDQADAPAGQGLRGAPEQGAPAYLRALFRTGAAGFDGAAAAGAQAPLPVQAKLAVAPSKGPLEEQADHVARAASAPAATTRPARGLRRPPATPPRLPATSPRPPATPNRLTSTAGEPLSSQMRERVEPVLGLDLADVRVHQATADREVAAGLRARAFTHGQHVFLGRGESAEDVELIAHELTHVAQQTGDDAPPVQRKPADYRHPEDGAGPRGRMRAAIDEELGDRSPPSERPAVDRARVAARAGQLEPQARPDVDRPAQERPSVEAAAGETQQVVDEPAKAEGGAEERGRRGGEAGERRAGEAEAAAAQASFSAALAEPPVAVPPPVAPVEQVAPADAGGRPLDPVPGADEAVAEIAMATQSLRDEGTGLQEVASSERANARILEGNIGLVRRGVAQSDLGVTTSQSHAAYRRTVVEQGRAALGVSREKTAWVAEQAPQHLEKADEGREDSEGMAEESASLSADSAANVPDDREAAERASEQRGEINRAGADVGNLDRAFSGSQERARGLSADAAQAAERNAQVDAKLNESTELLQRTDDRLGQMREQTDEARGQVEALAQQPAEMVAQADESEAEGRAVVDASFAVEERLRAEQETHRQNAAAIPEETPEERALRESVEGEAAEPRAEAAPPVQPVPAQPEAMEAPPGGGAQAAAGAGAGEQGAAGESEQGEGEQGASARAAQQAQAAAVQGGELPRIAPEPPGEGGSEIVVQRQPQAGYEDRWNVDLASPIASHIPQWLGGSAPREGDPQETREQREAREQARREQEILDIQQMAGRPFEQTTAWERSKIALRLMGRHLWSGLTSIRWPGWGALALGLINPVTPLLGVVSGFSMVASGAANLVNIEAWRRDWIGNLLKIAADIATGLTIILGSITALAAVVAALCTALILVSFGFLVPALGPVVAFCASVMVTVGGWTIAVGKWALLLQFLCFLKNLYEAGVARNAAELQQASDRMSSDVSAAGNVVLQMGMAKLSQVGGRGLQGSIARAGGGARWAGGLRTRVGTGVRSARSSIARGGNFARLGAAVQRGLPQVPGLAWRGIRSVGAGIRAMPGQAIAAARALPRVIRSPIQSMRGAFGRGLSRGYLVGRDVAPGWTGLRAAAAEGAVLAELEAATGLSTSAARQALRVWEREGIEMLLAEGLTGAEIRLLSQISQDALRRLLPAFTARELANFAAVVGPRGMELLAQVEVNALTRLLANYTVREVAGLIALVGPRGASIMGRLQPNTLRTLLADLPPQRAAQLTDALTVEVVERLTAEMTAVELNRVVNELGDTLVARMGVPGGLTGLELTELADAVAATRALPNIQGVDDWLRFEAGQDAAHARNAIAELREAQRLASESPGATVTIGGDANPPMRTPTDPMRSFDMTVEDPVAGTVRNVEVSSARGLVTEARQLTDGVQHAGDKAASRIDDGLPIAGDREAVIRMSFFSGNETVGRGGRGGVITYDGTGGYVLQPPHAAAPPRPGSILADFERNLPLIRNNDLLTRVRLVDNSGRVLAEFERVGGVWTRMR
ncbi:eCIS core domain-containing protein [Sorangium sp. So ce861]|uniref:eCIS core domain-containing protein n=1 Tax=Sorangium sp. So ce861 TaxID=3133323 RepID=UPI003F61A910